MHIYPMTVQVTRRSHVGESSDVPHAVCEPNGSIPWCGRDSAHCGSTRGCSRACIRPAPRPKSTIAPRWPRSRTISASGSSGWRSRVSADSTRITPRSLASRHDRGGGGHAAPRWSRWSRNGSRSPGCSSRPSIGARSSSTPRRCGNSWRRIWSSSPLQSAKPSSNTS